MTLLLVFPTNGQNGLLKSNESRWRRQRFMGGELDCRRLTAPTPPVLVFFTFVGFLHQHDTAILSAFDFYDKTNSVLKLIFW
jgi:hypothetical protein